MDVTGATEYETKAIINHPDGREGGGGWFNDPLLFTLFQINYVSNHLKTIIRTVYSTNFCNCKLLQFT
jgi:hypothetical protein